MSQVRPDPFTLAESHAPHRETSPISQLIGSGATALGRASNADGLGEYYTAFVGLSIVIERLAKLILTADYAIEHGGALPDQEAVGKFGHNLTAFSERADRIASKHGLTLEFPRPDDSICWAVLDCLDAFADASRGRYANFDAIPTMSQSIGGGPGWSSQFLTSLTAAPQPRRASDNVPRS